jgi:hypothetical protein
MKQPEILQLTVINNENDTYIPTEQVKQFLYCISKSFSTHHACSMSGISYERMTSWLNPTHSSYKEALTKLYSRAKAIAFGKHVEALHESKDWKAHAFWLERNEKDYAPRDKISGNVVNNIGFSSTTEHIQLSPEQMRSLSKAYDDMKKDAQPNEQS